MALHYLLSLISLISGLLFFGRLAFRWNLNHAAFLIQIIKLIQAGNIQRALKLSRVIPNSLYARVVSAIIQSAIEAPADPLHALTAAARGPFVAAMGDLNRWSMLGCLSGARTLAALGVGPALGSGWSLETHWGAAMSLAGGALVLLGAHTSRRIRRDLQELPIALLPTVIEELTGEAPQEDAIIEARGAARA